VNESYFSKEIIMTFQNLFLKNSFPNELGFSIKNISVFFECFEEMKVYEE